MYEIERLDGGNPAKAENELGWRREIGFNDLVQRMTESDIE